MLASLVLSLRAPVDLVLPRSLGRASYALLLRLIGERDPSFAASLHEAPPPRPFTCSNLVGGSSRGGTAHLPRDATAWLRFTSLTGRVSEHLLALAEDPPEEVELDACLLQVSVATVDDRMHPWAAYESYGRLCERVLHGPRPPGRRLPMRFASPTTFRSQGLNIPVPLPYLVFGSLLDRWEAFAPVTVSPEVRRYAQEMVVLSRYRLRTHAVPVKERGLQVGFVGEAMFQALNADQHWLPVLRLLSAYAFYAGVGAGTTMGMGQARATGPSSG